LSASPAAQQTQTPAMKHDLVFQAELGGFRRKNMVDFHEDPSFQENNMLLSRGSITAELLDPLVWNAMSFRKQIAAYTPR